MASWDSVQSPGPPDLRPPKIDFSPLGNIVNTYRQGTEANRQEAIRTALNDPSLYDEQGKIDANKAANKLFQLGGYDQARSVLTTAEFMKGAPQQQPGPWSIAAEKFLQPGQTSTAPPSGGGMQPQPVAEPRVGAGPVRDQNLSPEEQISPSQVAAANQPRPVPQQTGPALPGVGPAPVGPASAQAAPAQTAPEPTAVDTSAADSQVPAPFRKAGWSADRYRTMLHATAEQLRQQAAATEHQNAFGGIRQDTKPILDRAASLDAQAAKIDELLAPTTGQREVATNVAGEKVGQEEQRKRQEAYAGGIDAVARQYRQQFGRDILLQGRNILNQPQVYTGIGNNGVLDAQKIRAAFGGDPRGAQYSEALTKLGSLMALNTISIQKFEQSEAGGSGAGRIFSAMVDEARKTGLANENTLAGNRYLVEFHLRMGDFFAHLQDMKDNYLNTHKTLDRGFDAVVKKDMEQHPIFTPEERKNPSLIGAPTSPYGSIGQLSAWAQQMGLKPGEAVRTPSGYLTHVPKVDANGNVIPATAGGR